MTPQEKLIIQEITEIVRLMDSAFTIPIIKKSFGIDPLLGLIWGFGDVVAVIPALYIVARSKFLGLPNFKLIKMLRNLGLDAGIGLVPFVGQAADFFFKSNVKNLNIIHDHFGLSPYKRR